MKILSNKLNSELIFVYLPSFERTEKSLISDKKMYNYEFSSCDVTFILISVCISE